MNVLAIDSSNLTMGVAVANETAVLGEFITNTKKNHSVRLMPAVERLLKDIEMAPDDLDRVAVAQGPGSYTGVRIGVTVAKTLAWALGIELVGVSSLEVLAQNGRHFPGYVVPLFDARRGQVYTGLYRAHQDRVLSVENDRIVPIADWADALAKLDAPVLFLGSDVDKHWATIQAAMGENAVKSSANDHYPRPSELAKLGIRRDPVPVHEFTPEYLQLAEAEAKWLARQERK
ncbi:tRNA (adenosine(37)-N6)-threonylcarbamoyltransferase complex dimerization subunit type 1 TsaB [Caenibacillus caldisaponilyticus]|uniref:tRNA (adenosine(37)-N6)-threonylcarbamoyltransferase complex dimerization subunit type 1 TsaB n=1 Tax=Caenibacillus caldisaponilyticus TaxID=1674942 RepID=UPI00098855C8|nr:tRNA (adenosine(37)-N6)-threonylcarbamoyltransferase complex dimerization subunit type 1 TsaB [Caenibacillus caldisaponilyticus]